MPKLFCGKWGELGIFLAFAITENPYISRAFDARSSKQHWGFWIRVAPVYIAASRRAKLFFENKKSPFPIKRKNFKTKECEILSEIYAK